MRIVKISDLSKEEEEKARAKVQERRIAYEEELKRRNTRLQREETSTDALPKASELSKDQKKQLEELQKNISTSPTTQTQQRKEANNPGNKLKQYVSSAQISEEHLKNIQEGNIKEVEKDSPWHKKIVKIPEVYKDNKKMAEELLEDGFQLKDGLKLYSEIGKDTGKVMLGTTADAGLGIVKGIANVGEGIGDGITYAQAQVHDWLGNDERANQLRQNASIDVINNALKKPQEYVDKASVIGDTGDQITEGIGYMASIWAGGQVGGFIGGGSKLASTLGQAGVTFSNSAGSNMADIYQEYGVDGVKPGQAWGKALTNATVETVTEQLFGMFGNADTKLINTMAGKAKTGLGKATTRLLGQAGGEASEEIISYASNYLMDRVIDAISRGEGAKFAKEWSWEDLWEQAGIAAITALASGGGSTSASVIDNKTATNTWRDALNQTAIQEDVNAQKEGLDSEIKKLNKNIAKTTDVAQTQEMQNELNWKQKQLNALTLPTVNVKPKIQAENNEQISQENIIKEEQIRQASENFSKQVDSVKNGTFPKNDMLVLGNTPQALKDIGLPDLPITMTQKHLDTIMNETGKYKGSNYHNLGEEIVKQLPEAINNPLDIVKSKTKDDSVVLTTYLADKENRTVIASIKIDGKGSVNDIRIDTNVMTSAYGRNNYDAFMEKNLKEDNILYDIDRGVIKKVTGERLQLPIRSNFSTSGRLQLPTSGNTINNSITPQNENVNYTNNYAQERKNDTQINQNVAPSMGNNVQKYNKYKQNIIKSKEAQVNNLINFKNETSRNIDQKIAEKEALLNSKKNQRTKTASILKSQIENLKAQKQSIENLYNEKIDKTNSKISKEKIEFETRNRMKKEAREVIRAELAPLTEDLTKYTDKKAGWKYNRETAQRNIDDIVSDKELADSVKEIVFNPVQKDQANKTREINTIFERINSLGLDKKQKYYYVPKESKTGLKVDEATLAQLLIEKKITDKDLLKYDIDSKGIEKIHDTADTFKEILDDLYVRMNEQQLKYGYSPIGKIENYFPHFTEDKADTMLGKIASYFNIDLSNQSLPTDIAGLTDTFKPGETWNANIQKRRTEKTDYDALTAMERYVLGATEIIHITEDIQRIREYAKQIRYKYSDKAIQEEVDKIINNNELTQEAKDSALEGIFKNVENGLPNFVTWLDDYANTLAGKKAFADRNMERNIGRNMYKSMAGIESRIASNTIGGNVSVSLTNFAPLFQAMGTTKVNYLLTGMLQTTKNNITGIFDGGKDTSFANNSTFLTNRFGTDSISRKTFSQKFSDKASALMNMIDEFTAESIVRGKYLENLDSGMTEEQALKSADEYAGKIMADRSKGALPLIFNTKNPLSKLMTMFQVEPNNIVSNYFKDMPRDAKSDAQFTKQITKLMVASYVFNTLAMAIRGGNEVLPDPIRWVSYLIQMVTGDDDEKEKAKNDLVESLVGSTPFISNLAGFVGMEDIGRVPISNAMPDLTKISSLFDPEIDSKYKKETALKEFSKPFLYLGLPTGGAQLKKTVEGIATVNAGGSYKTNKKGETQLQFPVENANVLDYAKAGIFGKYSLSDSKAYADRGYKALSGKQTKTYQESGIPFKEYTEYIDSELKKNEDKINYINNTKWNTEQKWGIYINDILSDDERKDGGSQVSDAEYIVKNGTSKLDYINSYNKLQKNNLDIPTKEDYIQMKEKGVSLKGYTDYKTKVKQETVAKRRSGELTEEQELKDKDKLKILINSSYSQKETQGIYESYILKSTNKKYDIIKTTFTNNKLNIDKYLQYKLAEANGEFDADRKDDGTEKGEAIRGSAKQKRKEYIENMGITYTQGIILYGLECTPSYNDKKQIVNYINTMPNKTNKEKLDMLDRFEWITIYKDGSIKY